MRLRVCLTVAANAHPNKTRVNVWKSSGTMMIILRGRRHNTSTALMITYADTFGLKHFRMIFCVSINTARLSKPEKPAMTNCKRECIQLTEERDLFCFFLMLQSILCDISLHPRGKMDSERPPKSRTVAENINWWHVVAAASAGEGYWANVGRERSVSGPKILGWYCQYDEWGTRVE